jgi:lipoprotein-releasing system permease protein
MLIIDKKQDAITLRNLGANQHQIRSIFMMEGRMICLIGALIGITLGLILCWLQQEFGLIRFGNSEGSYIIDAYPVSVHPTDILLILLTVVAVGFLSVWYPVRYLTKKKLKN